MRSPKSEQFVQSSPILSHSRIGLHGPSPTTPSLPLHALGAKQLDAAVPRNCLPSLVRLNLPSGHSQRLEGAAVVLLSIIGELCPSCPEAPATSVLGYLLPIPPLFQDKPPQESA